MADALTGGRTGGVGDYRRKIVSVAGLLPSLEEARRQGWTIVQCHGCFDIVHPGHVRYLQFARQQGDILIVSITGDAAIDKGELRPYIPEELRAENLAALEFVDYVVVDGNASACKLLGTLRPDVYVKGQEYATSSHAGFVAERETVDSYGGRVVFSSGDVVFSSTRLIESLESDEGLDRQRLASVCGRHGIGFEALSDLLEAMRRKRVLVVGDSVVERYVLCEAESIASEAPVMSLRALDEREYVGAAAAVAMHAAGLGASSALVTTLGSDERSEWLRRQLRNANVELIVPGARRTTAARTRYLVDEQKVMRLDEAEVCPLDSIGERQAAELLLDQARGADVAIVCDGGLGTVTPGLLSRLGGAFHQRCATVIGAPFERRADMLALRHLTLCVCSERQLRATSRDSATGLSSLAYQALAATQSQRLLVTLGKRGMVTFDRPTHDPSSAEWAGRLRSEHLPALSGHARDRVGCGEAVAAAAALATGVGASLMQAGYLASAAATIEVERLGHVTLEAGMLRSWLRRREELRGEDGEVVAEPRVTAAAV